MGLSVAMIIASACSMVLVDRAVASITTSRTDVVRVADFGATNTVSSVSRVSTISEALLDSRVSAEQELVILPDLAKSLLWEDASASELSDALDFLPDSPDKLLASIDDNTTIKIGRATAMRPVALGEPSLGSLSGDDTSTGIRPIGGGSVSRVDVGSVTQFPGATSNRLETAPVPGAVLLAAFGIGLIGIGRLRGWVC